MDKQRALDDMIELGRQEQELNATLESVRENYYAAKLRKNEVEMRFNTQMRDIGNKQQIAADAYRRACSGESIVNHERLTTGFSQGPSQIKETQSDYQDDAGEQQSKRGTRQTHRVSSKASDTALAGRPTATSTGHNQKGFYVFIERFPTVVLSEDGVWVELRCPVCNGNTRHRKGAVTLVFFKGLKGLADHLWRAHGAEGRRLQQLSRYDLVEACKHKIVDDETAQTYLRADESTVIANPIEKVPCGRAPKSPSQEAVEDMEMPDSSPIEPAPANFRAPGFRSPQPARRTMPKHGESGILVRRRKRAISDDSSDSDSPPTVKAFCSMRAARGNSIRLSNPVETPVQERRDSTVDGTVGDKAIIRQRLNSD